jgi:SAM-dependent methyltransferase
MMRLRERRNLACRQGERFRPPIFKPNASLRNRVENYLRRFVDLQVGTIWRDLKEELGGASGVLVDIGCGAQVFRSLLPPEVTYLGIDREDAREHFGYEIPGTHYFSGQNWNIPVDYFDLALCTEVLEHVEDPLAFLRMAAACLKVGGKLVLTVPFAARWHFIPHDYFRYTPSGLLLLLTASGFDEVFITARGNPLTVACYKGMALIIMLFVPSSGGKVGRLLRLGAGIVVLPLFAILTVVANLSLRSDWGDDCLGYTVVARRVRAIAE